MVQAMGAKTISYKRPCSSVCRCQLLDSKAHALDPQTSRFRIPLSIPYHSAHAQYQHPSTNKQSSPFHLDIAQDLCCEWVNSAVHRQHFAALPRHHPFILIKQIQRRPVKSNIKHRRTQ